MPSAKGCLAEKCMAHLYPSPTNLPCHCCLMSTEEAADYRAGSGWPRAMPQPSLQAAHADPSEARSRQEFWLQMPPWELSRMNGMKTAPLTV